MGSLRWRKLPEQSPTRVYSEDKSEVLAAKATAIPTLELIKTQTKVKDTEASVCASFLSSTF